MRQCSLLHLPVFRQWRNSKTILWALRWIVGSSGYSWVLYFMVHFQELFYHLKVIYCFAFLPPFLTFMQLISFLIILNMPVG